MSQNGKYLHFFVILALVFFYAPALLLPIFAFNQSQVIAFPIEGFSLRWFEALLSERTLHAALKNSLLLEPILNRSLSLKTHLGNNALKVSGGQLQRISIARAIYRMPKILVLDEPTSALDEKNQDLFSKIVQNLKKNITVVIITHNRKLLEKCDKVYLLENKSLKEINNN